MTDSAVEDLDSGDRRTVLWWTLAVWLGLIVTLTVLERLKVTQETVVGVWDICGGDGKPLKKRSERGAAREGIGYSDSWVGFLPEGGSKLKCLLFKGFADGLYFVLFLIGIIARGPILGRTRPQSGGDPPPSTDPKIVTRNNVRCWRQRFCFRGSVSALGVHRASFLTRAPAVAF